MKIKVPKSKTRRSWKINPRTRVKEDDKAYRRPKAKAQERKMIIEDLPS